MTNRVERTELIQPGPAEGLGSLLGVDVPDLAAGEPLPLLWHWIYCLDRPAQRDLGVDGHPIRGSIPAPPGPGRRRMWAGGRVRLLGELRSGDFATRVSTILSSREKFGRSGALTFVTVGHKVMQGGRLVIDEEQDVVYREAVLTSPGADTGGTEELPEVVAPGPDEWSIDVDPTLLFRFSALTYNGHRIHYDRDYARDVEGYSGLLTHGPLQAVAMAEAARASGLVAGRGTLFDYRLVAPLFDRQGLIASVRPQGDGTATTVRDRFGRTTASGFLTRPADAEIT